MKKRSRTAQFGTDVAIEALGGTVAAIAIGGLGQIPALFGLIGGAVLASRIETALHQRRSELAPSSEPPPPPSAPPPTSAASPEPSGAPGGTQGAGTDAGSRPPRRFFTRSLLVITGTAVLLVVISFTVIELALGQSLIGGRETTFPTPTPEPETLLVPRVVGQPEAEARQRLRSLGFDVAIEERRFSWRPRGFVIATGPGAGRPAEKGSVVKLWLSLGEVPAERVSLPDLRNLPAAEAKTELEALGIKVIERIEYDGEADIGSVERTEPQGPRTVEKGSTVTVYSSGGEGEQLPDVRNKPVAEARSELEALGFTVDEQATPSTDVEIDEVVRTDPQGPQTVGKGSTVIIVRSLGPPVAVPELAGQSLEDAQAELLASGLTVGDISSEPSDGVPPNAVIRSDPDAKEQVSRGTAVNVVISSGPP